MLSQPGLPELKRRIWKGIMTCDSLQQIVVNLCQKLKRLPLPARISDGDGQRQASTPPLKKIIGQKEWWNGTHILMPNLFFQPFFVQHWLRVSIIYVVPTHFSNHFFIRHSYLSFGFMQGLQVKLKSDWCQHLEENLDEVQVYMP